MKKIIKVALILLSPLFLFGAAVAGEDSIGRRLFEYNLAAEYERTMNREINRILPARIEIDALLQTALVSGHRPKARPSTIVVKSPRPMARHDRFNPIVERLENIIAATPDSEIPAPPTKKVGISQESCIAIANYHEARGEGVIGQMAVSSVILQRAAVQRHWGKTPCQVVSPIQFSFMITKTSFPPIDDLEAWKIATVIAREILKSGPVEELRDADHYHAGYVAPVWRHKMPVVAVIGDHTFYADPLSRS